LLLFLQHLHAEAGLGGGGALKFGPEPAHQAGTFFGGTGGVELDQTEKNVLGEQFRGPPTNRRALCRTPFVAN
jgi:hypothetical protein